MTKVSNPDGDAAATGPAVARDRFAVLGAAAEAGAADIGVCKTAGGAAAATRPAAGSGADAVGDAASATGGE